MDILSPNDFLIDWEKIPEEKFNGLNGFTISKTEKTGNLQIRLVYYSEQYEADHWCNKGHVIYVQEGELWIDFKDGNSMKVEKGNLCVLGENNQPHKARTIEKAEVLIID